MPRPPQTDKIILPEQVASFAAASRRQIESWNENIPEYREMPGSQRIYSEMGRIYLERMREDGLDSRFKSSGTEGGIAVIPAFFFMGAMKAAQQGNTLEELKKGLYTKKSLESLTALTVDQNAVIVQLEMELGLRMGGNNNFQQSLDRFTFDPENGLGYTDLDRDRRTAYVDAYIRKGESFLFQTEMVSRCEGERMGVLQIAYRALWLIGSSDPNIFQATLDAETLPKEAAETA